MFINFNIGLYLAPCDGWKEKKRAATWREIKQNQTSGPNNILVDQIYAVILFLLYLGQWLRKNIQAFIVFFSRSFQCMAVDR